MAPPPKKRIFLRTRTCINRSRGWVPFLPETNSQVQVWFFFFKIQNQLSKDLELAGLKINSIARKLHVTPFKREITLHLGLLTNLLICPCLCNPCQEAMSMIHDLVKTKAFSEFPTYECSHMRYKNKHKNKHSEDIHTI